jgi:hypothetical protein
MKTEKLLTYIDIALQMADENGNLADDKANELFNAFLDKYLEKCQEGFLGSCGFKGHFKKYALALKDQTGIAEKQKYLRAHSIADILGRGKFLTGDFAALLMVFNICYPAIPLQHSYANDTQQPIQLALNQLLLQFFQELFPNVVYARHENDGGNEYWTEYGVHKHRQFYGSEEAFAHVGIGSSAEHYEPHAFYLLSTVAQTLQKELNKIVISKDQQVAPTPNANDHQIFKSVFKRMQANFHEKVDNFRKEYASLLVKLIVHCPEQLRALCWDLILSADIINQFSAPNFFPELKLYWEFFTSEEQTKLKEILDCCPLPRVSKGECLQVSFKENKNSIKELLAQVIIYAKKFKLAKIDEISTLATELFDIEDLSELEASSSVQFTLRELEADQSQLIARLFNLFNLLNLPFILRAKCFLEYSKAFNAVLTEDPTHDNSHVWHVLVDTLNISLKQLHAEPKKIAALLRENEKAPTKLLKKPSSSAHSGLGVIVPAKKTMPRSTAANTSPAQLLQHIGIHASKDSSLGVLEPVKMPEDVAEIMPKRNSTIIKPIAVKPPGPITLPRVAHKK